MNSCEPDLCILGVQNVLWGHRGHSLLEDQSFQYPLLSPLSLEIQDILHSPESDKR